MVKRFGPEIRSTERPKRKANIEEKDLIICSAKSKDKFIFQLEKLSLNSNNYKRKYMVFGCIKLFFGCKNYFSFNFYRKF